MSNTFVAATFGIGFGAWIYYKLMRQTGGNTKNSLIIAVLGGLVGAFVIYSIFGILFKEQ
jgi:hypothetical protein